MSTSKSSGTEVDVWHIGWSFLAAVRCEKAHKASSAAPTRSLKVDKCRNFLTHMHLTGFSLYGRDNCVARRNIYKLGVF
jgi:hypothetical protein